MPTFIESFTLPTGFVLQPPPHRLNRDKQKVSEIPKIDVYALIRQAMDTFRQEFEALFVLTPNAAFKCTNRDIPRFVHFGAYWHSFIAGETAILLGALNLQEAGSGDIQIVNQNKAEVQRMYGVCLQLYLNACRHCGVQPKQDLVNGLLIEWDFSGVQSPVDVSKASGSSHQRKPSH